MRLLKKPFFFFLALTLAFAVASCSDDDDDNSGGGPTGPSGGEFGTSTFTMSGDVEGERSGYADFQLLDLAGISHMWTIGMIDFNPQTFSLNLDMSVNSANSPQPGPGTYSIGIDPDNPTEPYFSASLTLIEDSDFENASEYHTIFSGGGTVTITEANDQEMVGTFEFTADEYDDMFAIIGTVNVSGSFSAVPVQ